MLEEKKKRIILVKFLLSLERRSEMREGGIQDLGKRILFFKNSAKTIKIHLIEIRDLNTINLDGKVLWLL